MPTPTLERLYSVRELPHLEAHQQCKTPQRSKVMQAWHRKEFLLQQMTFQLSAMGLALNKILQTNFVRKYNRYHRNG